MNDLLTRGAIGSSVTSVGRSSGRTRRNFNKQATYGKSSFGYVKPNLSKLGRQPPPEARNRLRSLSELGVVQLSSGSQMLLPSHVSHHLEHQRTESNKRLRWDFSESRITDDLATYRRFQVADAGLVTFLGLHQSPHEILAVLQKKEEIIVLPISADTPNPFKNIPKGKTISLTKNGGLKRHHIRR